MDRTLLSKLTCTGEEMPAGYLYTELLTGTNNLFLPGHDHSVNAYGTNLRFRLGSGTGGVSAEDTVVEILEYVSRKLERSDSDPFVKVKCLRVFKHLCERGHDRVRSILQRRYIHRIKACQTYRGPSHPLQGDAPSAAVRAEAEACLRCLYAHDNGGGTGVSGAMEARIEGFGSDSVQLGERGGERKSKYRSYIGSDCTSGGMDDWGERRSWSSSSHMTGFGNPHFSHGPQPSKGEQALQLISATASKILPTAVQEHFQKVVSSALPGGSSPVSMTSGCGSFRPPTYSRAGGGNWSRASGCGSLTSNGDSSVASSWSSGTAEYSVAPEGASGRASDSNLPLGDSPHHSRYFRPNMSATTNFASKASPLETSGPFRGVSDRVSRGKGGFADSRSETGLTVATSAPAGEYENRVVEELILPCGVKMTPSAAVLEEFRSKCQAVDMRMLGHIIQQKLQDETLPLVSRLRLLCGCEALLRFEQRRRRGGLGIVEADKGAGKPEISLRQVLKEESLTELRRCVEVPQLARVAATVLGFLDDTHAPGTGDADSVKVCSRLASSSSMGDGRETTSTAEVDLLGLGEDDDPAGRNFISVDREKREDNLFKGLGDSEESTQKKAGLQGGGPGKANVVRRQAELLDILSESPSTQVNSARSTSSFTGAPERCSFFSGLVVKNGKQPGVASIIRDDEQSFLDLPLQQSTAPAPRRPPSENPATGATSASSALERSCDKDMLSLDSLLSSSLHSGAHTPAHTGFPLARQAASSTAFLTSSPPLSDIPKHSSPVGVRVVPSCGPSLSSAGAAMSCRGSGGLSPTESNISAGVSLPSSTSLTSLVGESPSTPSDATQQSMQSRTAHLDRVFSSSPSTASPGQSSALPTGYAALFPQQQHTSLVGLHRETQGYRPVHSAPTPSRTPHSCIGLSPPSALLGSGQTGAADVGLGKSLGGSGAVTQSSSQQDARRKFAFVSS